MASGPTETDLFVRGQEKVQPTKWESFRTFLYNPKEGTVLGRTGKSWLQITIFYLIFYGVLAAFFSVLLILFLQTLDERSPKWQGNQGIIGSTPGMGFRPELNDSSTTLYLGSGSRAVAGNDDGKNLVRVDRSETHPLARAMNDYFNGTKKTGWKKDYADQDKKENLKDCSWNSDGKPTDKQACRFDLNQLGPCAPPRDFTDQELRAHNNYGYYDGQPCVLIKLNRIYGWVPEPVTNQNMRNELSQSLTTMYGARRAEEIMQQNADNSIIFTCEGEDPVDKENIGAVRIHPPAIPGYYYPYLNQENYVQPIAMLEFLNLQRGVLVNVECRAWANNIEYNRVDKQGALHFEVMVE